MEHSIAQSRPRYLAFISSSGLEIGAIADLIAHSYDVNLALDAKAASLLEAQTVQWLGEFVGYPASAGWFTSGGMLSNLSALTAARERALPRSRHTGIVPGSATLYCSSEAHYSVTRAAEILGIGSDWVRQVRILQPNRGLDAQHLRELVQSDVEAGRTPIAIIGTAGTTLTGAVDPLDDIANICDEFGVWFHVDGAYGAPAASTYKQALFRGIERADSVTIDAHKWMFVPKACSVLMVREPDNMLRVFSHDENYMPHAAGRSNAVDMTLEYSRPLRSMKLWLAFKVHGRDEFVGAIERNLRQAELTYQLASQDPAFELMQSGPSLSVVPLRHIHPGCPDIDEHNGLLHDAIQQDGSSFVAGASIDGQRWLRPCFTNIRTRTEDVQLFLNDVKRVGASICPQHGASS
jgi:aromatic-L-amino-acid decarboxylase